MENYKSTYAGSQIDTAIGRALPGGEIDASLSNNAADHPHRNLLDNWDFRNPINQRGLTSYGSSGYTIDRFRQPISHTVQLLSDCVKITFAGWLPWSQYIYLQKTLSGNTVTFSVDVKSYSKQVAGVIYADGVVLSNFVITKSGINSHTFVLPTTLSTSLMVGIYGEATATLDVYSVKLELGSVSTLANDPPADHEAEKAKCKRYFNLWATEAARTAALLEVGAMRTTPVLSTIDIGGVTYYTASADL
jgi:hypothetical protein